MSDSLPAGFQFSGTNCGIKDSGKPDLATITTQHPIVAAGVYTTNVVHAASIDWNRAVTPTDQFRGLVINSGNANACTGTVGVDDNRQMAKWLAEKNGCDQKQICVLSTGVIGQHLPMEKLQTGIPAAGESAGSEMQHFDKAATAILTTDNGPKTVHRSVVINGETIRISGMAKGAGMIGPRMATMLAVITTDAKLEPALAQKLIAEAANQSFNCISVEGHMSTSDALLLLCSGQSEAQLSDPDSVEQFSAALNEACLELAKTIPADGEGASHLIEIKVSGTVSASEADRIARSIAASALVKTAITGNDPNWGRIVSAAGYCDVDFAADEVGLKLNGHSVFERGQPVDFSTEKVSHSIRDCFQTTIDMTVGSGSGSARHWTSDLTVAYVEFNSEYTT